MNIEIENQNVVNLEVDGSSEVNYETSSESVDIEIGNSSSINLEIGASNGIDYEIGKNKNSTSYNPLTDKPQINGVELVGNKTTSELGIVGTSMTEIELSTDITNPTEILNYIGKSGTYVAKNTGILGNESEPMVALAKGQFFSIHNLKDYANELGLGDEVSDSDNFIDIDGRLITGEHITVRMYGNGSVEQLTWLNSENVNDYVDSFNPADFINSNYGITIVSNKLAINPATQTDINNGTNNYKPITSYNSAYLVQQKGKNYFADKTEFTTLKTDVETLETDLSTLKSEIETILESVVSIDE